MTLEQTARKTAGCSVASIGWLAVRERFCGEVIWDGPVELFLSSGRSPIFVYGWTVEGDADGPEHVTVLRGGEIDSPRDAIHAWIVSRQQAHAGERFCVSH